MAGEDAGELLRRRPLVSISLRKGKAASGVMEPRPKVLRSRKYRLTTELRVSLTSLPVPIHRTRDTGGAWVVGGHALPGKPCLCLLLSALIRPNDSPSFTPISTKEVLCKGKGGAAESAISNESDNDYFLR